MARPCDTLEEVLMNADFVSIHVPEMEGTKNLISTKQIQLMKDGSYLLNASRGSVVDLAALQHGLNSKKLAGTALDVYPCEPEKNNCPFESALAGIPNVILTPHIGGCTEEAQAAIGFEVATNLSKYIRFGTSIGCINLPEIDVKITPNTSFRLVNIHKNVPGVLKVSQVCCFLSELLQIRKLTVFLVVTMLKSK